MKNLVASIPDDYHKTVFWKAPNPMGITTARDGIYLDVNEAFTKYFGVQRQEVIGKSSVELGHLSKAKRLKVFNAIKEKGHAKNILVEYRDRNNALQSVLINTTPVKVKEQVLWHTILTAIPQIKPVQKTKRDDVFAELLDSLDTIGIVVFNDYENKKPSIFYVNEMAKKILEKEPISYLLNALNRNESIFLNTRTGYYHVRKISTSRSAPLKIIAMERFPNTELVEGQMKQRGLTPRQQEIAFLVATGYSNSEIAEKLGITKHTVKDHMKKIFQIFDVHNRGELGPKILSWR
jgi:PAS domain S-box-containing protein